MRSLADRETLAAAAAILRKEAKARKGAKREWPKGRRVDGQRDPARKDRPYLSWLHIDIPCIACLIEGRPRGVQNLGPIEAAHQKLAIASAGWREGGLGPKTHDERCVPLCRWHHRLARDSCDLGGQRKFWDRLGLGDRVAALCADLFEAFRRQQDGRSVVRRYAAEAKRGLT